MEKKVLEVRGNDLTDLRSEGIIVKDKKGQKMNRTEKHGIIIGGCTIAICLLYIRFLLSNLSMSNFEWGLFGLFF